MRFGPVIGRRTLILLAGSCGMYIAAPAFLPSSFSMCLGMIALGAWFQRDYTVSGCFNGAPRNICTLVKTFNTHSNDIMVTSITMTLVTDTSSTKTSLHTFQWHHRDTLMTTWKHTIITLSLCRWLSLQWQWAVLWDGLLVLHWGMWISVSYFVQWMLSQSLCRTIS